MRDGTCASDYFRIPDPGLQTIDLTSGKITATPIPMNPKENNQQRHHASAWASKCKFSPLSNTQVLDAVVSRAKQSPQPVVILDLDSTLYEVGPRSLTILKEWAEHAQSDVPGEIKAVIKSLELSQMAYTVHDTLSQIGLSVDVHENLFASAKDFWTERFFTNQYLTHDRMYDGVFEFTQTLHEMGVHLVYLTGRDEPRMGEGTRSNIVRDRLPWNHPKTSLFLKPEKKMDDLEFKKAATQIFGSLGEVIASFENEPANVVAISEIFPEAMHIFVDTICSNNPAPIKDGLYRISGFTKPQP